MLSVQGLPEAGKGAILTCVAHAGRVDLDADLVGLGRRHLDVLDAQLLASLPGNGGLAGDSLCKSPLEGAFRLDPLGRTATTPPSVSAASPPRTLPTVEAIFVSIELGESVSLQSTAMRRRSHRRQEMLGAIMGVERQHQRKRLEARPLYLPRRREGSLPLVCWVFSRRCVFPPARAVPCLFPCVPSFQMFDPVVSQPLRGMTRAKAGALCCEDDGK